MRAGLRLRIGQPKLQAIVKPGGMLQHFHWCWWDTHFTLPSGKPGPSNIIKPRNVSMKHLWETSRDRRQLSRLRYCYQENPWSSLTSLTRSIDLSFRRIPFSETFSMLGVFWISVQKKKHTILQMRDFYIQNIVLKTNNQ